MSTKTNKVGLRELFKKMFSADPDIEEYEEKILSAELKNALYELKNKEKVVETGFNNDAKHLNKGSFGNNPKTEKNMRKMHEEVKSRIEPQKEQKGYEIGD